MVNPTNNSALLQDPGGGIGHIYGEPETIEGTADEALESWKSYNLLSLGRLL